MADNWQTSQIDCGKDRVGCDLERNFFDCGYLLAFFSLSRGNEGGAGIAKIISEIFRRDVNPAWGPFVAPSVVA